LWLPKDSWHEPFIVPNEAIVLYSIKIWGRKQRGDLIELFSAQLLKIIPTYWGQKKLRSRQRSTTPMRKMLGSKPTEAIHLKEFSLEKLFGTCSPQL
jgi:hypothetical protein